MKLDLFSRRGFLQGLGVSLALPVLPSLLPRTVAAQTMPVQKTFVGVVANNGLYRMYGPDSQLMPPLPLDLATYNTKGLTAVPTARHTIHTKALADLAASNGGAISDLIDSSFTPLLPKMLMMQGFDYLPLGWAHHQAHFGNMGDDGSFQADGNPAMVGIDQVMGYSSSFYKNPSLKGRTVAFTANSRDASSGYQAGFSWQDPSHPSTSAVVYTSPVYSDPLTLFNAYFMTATQQTVPLRKTLVDRVLGDYNSLRQSNTRLGAVDRQRLELHIQFLQETQQKVMQVGPVCSQMQPASNLTDRKLILNTINSVITSMAACGLCHSFLGWAHSIADDDPENYHKWSHEGFDNSTDSIANQTSYTNLVEHNRNIIKEICLDLALKLDANQLLDTSFVACVQEHNNAGHQSWNVPIITFGSAGGAFKTGQYIDYRDMSDRDDHEFQRFGYPINQFLANVLRAVDVPQSEFEPLNQRPSPVFRTGSGYGISDFNNATTNAGVYDGHYGTGWQGHDLSDWLPAIT